MARLSVTAAGSSEQGINKIDAKFWAESVRNIRGYDVAVLDNSFMPSNITDSRVENINFMWKINIADNYNIEVGRGMATAYGYDIKSDGAVKLSVPLPASGKKYAFVYLEWDFSNPQLCYGNIDLHDNGASSAWQPLQDNLITIPNGKYQLPLYRIEISFTGQITETISWRQLGVATMNGIIYSLSALQIVKGGNIAQNVTAYTQAQTDDSNKLATTSYVRQAISDVKNITSAGFLFVGMPATIKRQVNFVYCDFSARANFSLEMGSNYFSIGSLMGNIPLGFKPNQDINAILVIRRDKGFGATSILCLIKAITGEIVSQGNFSAEQTNLQKDCDFKCTIAYQI